MEDFVRKKTKKIRILKLLGGCNLEISRCVNATEFSESQSDPW